MTTYFSQARAYRESAVLGRTPEQLVPLLYEHLLVQLVRGAQQIRMGDFEGKADALSRASDILFEMLESLDFEAGGEVASRLSTLYGYFLREVELAGRSMDAAPLDRLVRMVEVLHAAWSQAAGEVTAGRDLQATGR